MPRPNKAWEKKYGKHSPQQQKKTLLSGDDNLLSACQKLSCGSVEAMGILAMALRVTDSPVIRLLDADDMGMHGEKIVKAYHDWAKDSYEKLLDGLKNRDASLISFLNNVKE